MPRYRVLVEKYREGERIACFQQEYRVCTASQPLAVQEARRLADVDYPIAQRVYSYIHTPIEGS